MPSMKKTITIGILFFVSILGLKAQLGINNSFTPQQLVQNILVGPGVSVTNVTFSGGGNAIGSFSNGNATNLGLNNGVVLCSGKIFDIPNPVTEDASESLGISGDIDIDNVTGSTSHDAAVLEFDFVPVSDTIRFRYVFGSEEYPEYVCSSFNDAFAYFVSGPRPGGGQYFKQNIALIPGTNLPVAINTVNNGHAGDNYDASGCISVAYSNLYIDNSALSGTSIVYDGFTKVFTAWCLVVPCQTYHIKIAVADVSDGALDSGVFLDAGSFSSSNYSVTAHTVNMAVGNDTSVYEGCSATRLKFKRSGTTISNQVTLHFNISGNAINGVDYTHLPDSVIFMAGKDTVSLLLNPIMDGISESPELVKISIPVLLVCTSVPEPSISILINDSPPLYVSLMNDTTIICPSSFTVTSDVSGGVMPFFYSWSNGSNASSIQISPTSTTTYSLIVMDGCGSAASGNFTVNIPVFEPLLAVAFGDTIICSGTTVPLFATATGGVGSYSFLWSHNLGTNNLVNVTPEITTNYSVSVTDSCGAISATSVTVTVLPVNADFSYSYISNREIQFKNLSVNGFIFDWDFGDGVRSPIKNPSHTYADTGKYVVTLTVTNDVGCISQISREMTIYPDIHVYVPNAFTPDGNALNDDFYPVAVGVIRSEMMIFDRWGNLIFSSTDLVPIWTGIGVDGKKAPVGVYVYVLNYETPIGKKYKFNGTVTLMR
jgi:gliding motility-associated-like protein